MMDDAEVKAMLDGATPGPWEWGGHPDNLKLQTVHHGKLYVMDFVRKGFSGAQPRFQPAKRGMVNADVLLQFQVGDQTIVGEKAARADGSVYRYDVRGVDAPDARLIAAAPDLARALLAARADTEAAVALALEEAAKQCEFRDHSEGEEETEFDRGYDQACDECATIIRALATASGVAKLAALRAEARESAMQALASMGQAQEAYEAQLKAEAERETLTAEVARLRDREVKAATIAKQLAYWLDTDAEVLADMDARDMSDHQHITEQVRRICATLATDSDAALSAAQPAGMAGKGGSDADR